MHEPIHLRQILVNERKGRVKIAASSVDELQPTEWHRRAVVQRFLVDVDQL